jgi:small-conductance mechanosensitive channel
LISGVILLMDRSLKPGDIIQIRDTYGWIASLGARYVSVETRDGVEYLIPNEDIITQQVINWTHKNDLARIKVQVRVSFDSDVDTALDLLVRATDRPTRILRSPEPRALLMGFGDNGLELELRFWIHDVQNGIRNISSEVMLEIWALFREHGIQIPLPQHDLHLRDTPFDTMSGADWRGSTPPRGWPPQDRSPPGRPNSGVGRFPWPRR